MSIFIDVHELEQPVKWIDTRFNLAESKAGYTYYLKDHIESAVYWHLEDDLSDMTCKDGRHPMPSKAALQLLFERSGLLLSDSIVIYDQGGTPFAPRAWFMLMYAGFQNVKIVNGGYAALVAAGFPISAEPPEAQATSLEIEWQESLLASRSDVKQVVDAGVSATLLDARSYERYIGKVEPLDPIAGHIPTAHNFDWEQLKDGAQFVRSEKLASRYKKDNSYIVYCGSGVTAAPLFASLFNEGYNDIKLYVGSYSDWITTYPVATGDEME